MVIVFLLQVFQVGNGYVAITALAVAALTALRLMTPR